ncbi:predicted protein [Chaetoceros tenuissimus]|uniref:Uncharacterized protein n=1 Tax=Chaetoceros tenuissimus TaxID=426638 RepID=A0AAD3CEG1_9STRA|nr:predicted protein [Chaetoceros tenuissimus]
MWSRSSKSSKSTQPLQQHSKQEEGVCCLKHVKQEFGGSSIDPRDNISIHEGIEFHNNKEKDNNFFQKRRYDNMLSQEKCSVLFDEIDSSSQRVRSNMNKQFFFYIVHNNEITGRYDGANLIDALSHLQLYGKMITLSSFPKDGMIPNQNKAPRLPSKSTNRALIPVINNRICHPFELLSFRTTLQDIVQQYEHELNKEAIFKSMQCCYWNDSRDLQRMQYIVRCEHLILHPAMQSKSQLQRNSTIIVSLPNVGRNGETDFSSRVRSKCLEFLRDIQEDNNVDIHVVEDDHAEK